MKTRNWIVLSGILLIVFGAGLGFIFYFKTLIFLWNGIPQSPDLTDHPKAYAQAVHQAENSVRSWNQKTVILGVTELGKLYHANGYLKEAQTCWTTLKKVDSKNARWGYYLVDVQRLMGDETSMRPLLVETIRLQPDYAPAWLKLGNFDFTAGELDQAAESYKQRLKLIENDAYAAVGLARVALQSGDSDNARFWLKRSIKGEPKLPLGHNLYARLLAAEGNVEEAEHQRWLGTAAGRFREAPDPWIEALNAYCYDIEQLLMLGSIDFQTGHGDLGTSLFERAIKLNPQHADSYEALGRVYLEKGDIESARKILQAGVEFPSASATMFVRLSETYRQMGKLDKALEVTQIGLSRKAEDPDILRAVGTILDEKGEYEEAIAVFKKAMTDVSYAAESSLSIALVLEHAGRKEEAYEYLYRALELRPKYPQAMAELGVLELDAWNLEKATEYIEGFYEAYPGSSRATALMTQLSVRKSMQAAREGDLGSAENFAKEGLNINPDSPELNSVLGLLYAQQQRHHEAIVVLETARLLQPGDPRIVMPLVQVYRDLGRLIPALNALTEGIQRAESEGKKAAADEMRQVLMQMPKPRR